KPEEVLGYLASIESESSHPLARAVLDEIGQITFSTVENTEVIKGGGIVADVNGHKIAVGNLGLMEEENVKISKKARKDIDQLIKKGNSLVLTAVDGELKVAMGVRDQIREGAKEDLEKLRSLGVKNLVMLSGDNQGTVDVISKELELTEAYGDM